MGQGHSAGWLTHIKVLKKSTKCITLMFVSSGQYEEAENALKTEMDLYVKEFIYPDDAKHRVPTILDVEFTSLVKTIQPEATLLLIDSKTPNIEILKGFSQALASGRVGAVMWEHYSHDASSELEQKNLQAEVELMVTEGFNVYMPSSKHKGEDAPSKGEVRNIGAQLRELGHLGETLSTSVSQTLASAVVESDLLSHETKYHSGPWLRIEGAYWDDVYGELPGVDKETGVAIVAIKRSNPFRALIDQEGLICRPPQVLSVLSRYDKKWIPTTNLVDHKHPLVSSALHKKDNATNSGLCECQPELYTEAKACALFSPPPPVPSGSLFYADWYKHNTDASAKAPPAMPAN
eukprot:CAMPEP_0196598698 /NCGR_PEP_ID=MMETSP1081-20130531/94459_1 /TAXON_ID=36882 /ORGANISM="Pyramimonas amylifera, Strain CCMP720" /LENGTH=348 /DNA_ID=CAMNT_0041924415 /DNA_START=835 /DNA_END=1881 /DNA_ORIENTATION=-